MNVTGGWGWWPLWTRCCERLPRHCGVNSRSLRWLRGCIINEGPEECWYQGCEIVPGSVLGVTSSKKKQKNLNNLFLCSLFFCRPCMTMAHAFNLLHLTPWGGHHCVNPNLYPPPLLSIHKEEVTRAPSFYTLRSFAFRLVDFTPKPSSVLPLLTPVFPSLNSNKHLPMSF